MTTIHEAYTKATATLAGLPSEPYSLTITPKHGYSAQWTAQFDGDGLEACIARFGHTPSVRSDMLQDFTGTVTFVTWKVEDQGQVVVASRTHTYGDVIDLLAEAEERAIEAAEPTDDELDATAAAVSEAMGWTRTDEELADELLATHRRDGLEALGVIPPLAAQPVIDLRDAKDVA